MPNHGVYRLGRRPRQRVQRPRPVPARAQRRRQRGDAGHRVPHLAQRRHRQICAARRPLRRQAGHADRHHGGRPGAEGRDQPRARRRSIIARPRFLRARSARSTNSSPGANRADRHRAGSGRSNSAASSPARRAACQTNRPVAGATVEVYRVSPIPASASAAPIHASQTGADGRWGPAQVDPSWYLEMVLTSPGSTTTHFYRSPFPRSSDIVHLRAARALGPADAGAGAVVLMSRPRGYFGLPRDVVVFDGKEPADVKAGRADRSLTTLRLSAAEIGPSGGGAVQPGTDRRAGMAGVGKPYCGRRTDLLARLLARRLCRAAAAKIFPGISSAASATSDFRSCITQLLGIMLRSYCRAQVCRPDVVGRYFFDDAPATFSS